MSRSTLEIGAFYWAIPAFDVDSDVSIEDQLKPQPAKYLGDNKWFWIGYDDTDWPSRWEGLKIEPPIN